MALKFPNVYLGTGVVPAAALVAGRGRVPCAGRADQGAVRHQLPDRRPPPRPRPARRAAVSTPTSSGAPRGQRPHACSPVCPTPKEAPHDRQGLRHPARSRPSRRTPATSPAGNVTLGVEYRALDPESLVETYKHDAAQLAELVERVARGRLHRRGRVVPRVRHRRTGTSTCGSTCSTASPTTTTTTGADEIVNNVIDFDVAAHGDMLPWALDCLRGRLPEMLTEAGGAALVAGLDQAAIGRVVDELAAIAASVQPVRR